METSNNLGRPKLTKLQRCLKEGKDEKQTRNCCSSSNIQLGTIRSCIGTRWTRKGSGYSETDPPHEADERSKTAQRRVLIPVREPNGSEREEGENLWSWGQYRISRGRTKRREWVRNADKQVRNCKVQGRRGEHFHLCRPFGAHTV